VQLVKVDMTNRAQVYTKDLLRVDRSTIPVNLIYPASYPEQPAILLEEMISAGQILEALKRVAPTESER